MPALSFRSKLLLAMMLVVVGVTAATLFVTQQYVQTSYHNLFHDQFASQLRLFTEMQSFRLSTATNKCLALAKSVRLQEALQADVAKDIAEEIQFELKEVLSLEVAGHGNFVAKLLCFLNAEGQFLPLSEQLEQANAGLNVRKLATVLAGISQSMKPTERQQIGYVSVESAKGEQELLEIIVTKVIDSTDGSTLMGTLVLGFPMLYPGDEYGEDPNQFKSGFLLKGQLYSHAIPLPDRGALAQKLATTLRSSAAARDDLVLDIGGIPHQVFLRPLNAGSVFATVYQVGFYSLQKLFRELAELRRKILGVGGLVLVVAFAVDLALAHGLTATIRELVAGTAQIQRGNFQVKVPVRSRDEIGGLASSFNEMAEGLALKEKYRSVLDKVTDKEVALQLMSGGVALGGELREISVLFCDIRGFTALTQNMDPAEVIRMLNEHFTPLTRVVYEHNGVVDKFVGDLIMAVFGAPKSYGNDALNAACCALEMIRERQKLNATSLYKIEMGIGVATGSAVAGCMGSQDRLNYTVLGKHVNLASRLCSKAGRMEVVIDKATLHRLGESQRVEPLAELELKGFSERVPAYKLIEARSSTALAL
jgi:class 3 adenylate cyclase